MRPEIRKDYIQDKYVIIAPIRKVRTRMVERPEIYKTPEKCVFCPWALKKTKTRIIARISSGKRNAPWDIAVISNKYPAVTLDNPKAYGKQEVVIETPNHRLDFGELPAQHIANIFTIYAKRTRQISANPKIEYILIFKNTGGKAGASIQHAHSQIFATSFLPPHLLDKSQKAQQYKLKHGSCVYCDVIKKESEDKRLVYKDAHVIAFTPYASIYNYEIWIMPLRHLDNVTLLNNHERMSFANILKKIVKKIGNLSLHYNFYFHQVIHDHDQHLYMKVVPRGSAWAGVEIGSGVVINPVSPEEAARYYRE